MGPYEFLDHPGPLAFAHRGGAFDAPENTMPAFQRAVDLGFRYLETDVQATSDGVIVAFHDDDLRRTTGRQMRISETPWEEVRRARVDGVEPIPLLDDVLAAFPQACINIDCKSDHAVSGLIAALRRHRAETRVCIGSFSGRRLTRIRAALGPRLCTSMGPWEALRWRGDVWAPGRLRLTPRVPVVQVPVRAYGLEVVTAASVAAAHAVGVQVHVWTIDDPDEMRRLLDLGVDGIMTDRPLVLRSVLQERGRWV